VTTSAPSSCRNDKQIVKLIFGLVTYRYLLDTDASLTMLTSLSMTGLKVSVLALTHRFSARDMNGD
jgi:hypothetical protein